MDTGTWNVNLKRKRNDEMIWLICFGGVILAYLFGFFLSSSARAAAALASSRVLFGAPPDAAPSS
jgi:hypothetical protein